MKKNSFIILSFLFSFAANAQKIPSWKIKDVADYCGKRSDSVYVINFWATFSDPCIREINYLQNITKKYAQLKVKLLLVSMDPPSFYPRKVKGFVKKNNFTADVVWLDETDAGYFCPVIDKGWSGALPATLLVNASNGYKKFIGPVITDAEFEKELRIAIGKD